MDNNYLFKQFENTIQKLVRNYVFELDKKLSDGDNEKYGFDNNFDYVKVHSLKLEGSDVIVTYQILNKRTLEVQFFEDPVEIRIPLFYMFCANYEYQEGKYAR